MHPLILFDANLPGELERAEVIGGKILELCVAVGGSITVSTGRPGKDQPDVRTVQQRRNHRVPCGEGCVRPQGLLNPGKNIPTLRCAEFGALHVHHGQLLSRAGAFLMSMDHDDSQALLEQVNQALNQGTALRIQGSGSSHARQPGGG